MQVILKINLWQTVKKGQIVPLVVPLTFGVTSGRCLL
jgi:hypothetical protein